MLETRVTSSVVYSPVALPFLSLLSQLDNLTKQCHPISTLSKFAHPEIFCLIVPFVPKASVLRNLLPPD